MKLLKYFRNCKLVLIFIFSFLFIHCTTFKYKTYEVTFKGGFKRTIVGTHVKIVPATTEKSSTVIFIYDKYDLIECITDNVTSIKIIQDTLN